MSVASLENEIARALRAKTGNQRITRSWIQEWSSRVIEPQSGEELIEITEHGFHIWVAIKQPVRKT